MNFAHKKISPYFLFLPPRPTYFPRLSVVKVVPVTQPNSLLTLSPDGFG